jgi:hypothetical protein
MTVFDKLQWEFTQADIPWQDGRQVYDLWQSKCSSGKLPKRSDFEPKDLVKTLNRVMLVDVSHNPLDFTVRLAGTFITGMMDRDPTGMRVKDMRGGSGLFARFAAAEEARAPYLAVDLETPFESRHYPSYSVLVLPLANDPSKINMLMMALHFGPSD